MAAPKGNKFALGNNGGQPPKFETPEQLAKKCDDYFKECKENDEKATITGLTLFVGFCSRSSWDDYKKREEFSYVVKRANLAVQNSYETKGTAFDIFALKNMGWDDKSIVEQTNDNYNHKPRRANINFRSKKKED
jgi:hypothetical protein